MSIILTSCVHNFSRKWGKGEVNVGRQFPASFRKYFETNRIFSVALVYCDKMSTVASCRSTLTSPHPLNYFWLKLLTQEVKIILILPLLRKMITEVTLKSVYPLLEGKCGRFYRFDIRNNDITNWDKPWLSELDITSGISEIKLLISDFQLWISDFQELRFAISDFWILVSDFWFLNSVFKFQSFDFWIAISNIGLIMAWKSNISYLK